MYSLYVLACFQYDSSIYRRAIRILCIIGATMNVRIVNPSTPLVKFDVCYGN